MMPVCVAVGDFTSDLTWSLKDRSNVTGGCSLMVSFGFATVGKRIALAIAGKTPVIGKFRAASSAVESTFLRRLEIGQSRYSAPNFNDRVKSSWLQPVSA
jgi:hypothetical protein